MFLNDTIVAPNTVVWMWGIEPDPNNELPDWQDTQELFKREFMDAWFGGDYKVWTLPEQYTYEQIARFAHRLQLAVCPRDDGDVESRSDKKDNGEPGNRFVARDSLKTLTGDWSHLGFAPLMEEEQTPPPNSNLVLEPDGDVGSGPAPSEPLEVATEVAPPAPVDSKIPITPGQHLDFTARTTEKEVLEAFYRVFGALRLRTDQTVFRNLDGNPLEPYFYLPKETNGNESRYRLMIGDKVVWPKEGDGANGREVVAFLDGLVCMIYI